MSSTTVKRHRMRCGVETCRQRFTLRRNPEEYVRAIKCPSCGDHLKVRSVEAERQRELVKQDTCSCGGYPFPHRKGSMRGCADHPRAIEEFTQEEIHDYEACMRTPRSG